eukprot:CAMPEP_0206502348 /NCGR_PEP_ID=MMETSP0324_2-20121206/53945_1 /ASSEMBLY_ACC=CAM_ASM_000836 /TAXON_ID=2866 /ORGANISM="Crypthecodinium cohnii, Strain Seligo" /LENGTH=639 /DNA_ID=CAMNT_0053990527 /DNA_START=61 /DNA_END=1977 /DNA_ORIENTATION=+
MHRACRLLLSWSLCCSLCIQVLSVRPDSDTDLIISTRAGPVRGKKENGLRSFRGIPYARPPLKERRWKPPQAHPKWTEVRDATTFGATCLSPRCWNSEDMSRVSEDCLFLNVLTPPSASNLPVVVWIHAGGFQCGSSNDAESNSPQFAKEVVYVTLNYRLGAFGFLGSEELKSRDPNQGTGNYGMLDQKLALSWVRDNIKNFGGDPTRITIAGESAGGSSVAYHLLTNDGKPTDLFQRAILQSPGITQVQTLAAARTNFEWLLAALAAQDSPGCPQNTGYLPFPSASLSGALHTSQDATQQTAEAWCDKTTECIGFTFDASKGTAIFSSKHSLAFTADNSSSSSIKGSSSSSSSSSLQAKVYLKRGPKLAATRMACLEQADAQAINDLSANVPMSDTFVTDAFAPVVDGVYLKDSLMNLLLDRSKKNLVPHVPILLGTNLDEGTQFMDLTPALDCSADKAAFAKWSTMFFGSTLGAPVPELYEPAKLEQPVPQCRDGTIKKEELYYNSAMRSASDAVVRCPAMMLAKENTSPSFLYLFTLAPTKSVNLDNIAAYGVFHGAEVPFVFGAGFELQPGVEQTLSSTMGCLWLSFATSGDPNSRSCGNTFWPSSHQAEATVPYLELGKSLVLHSDTQELGSKC